MTRFYRKKVRNSGFSKGIFSWIGFNTFYIPYEVTERYSGETKWSFFKLFGYAINGIIGYSTRPLKISSIVGALTAMLSFIYLIKVILNKLIFGVTIPGYTTIVSLILLVSGIQMILIGILGEYISHIFLQVKDRPIYILKDKIQSEIKK